MGCTRSLCAAIVVVGLVAACGSDDEAPLGTTPPAASTQATAAQEPTATQETSAPAEAPLPTGAEEVPLDAADFVARIDNPYWPMAPGTRWVYRETDGEGGEQKVEVTVTDQTKEILGIAATVVHDVVSEDGQVVEDTYDWYAQDRHGNVWYLGEDTKEFEDGKAVSAEGSWEAGVDGAQAGVIMPAHPRVGMAYRQEYYAGDAEDEGAVLSLDEWLVIELGSYRDVLLTKDFTPLEPDVLEYKLYAKGVGPVLTLDVSGGSGREELVRFEPGG